MPVQNAEIAALFTRYADLLEVEDANPFRVRAYRNAARVVGGDSRSMADLLSAGRDLTELPGIGKDLAAKIAVVVATGRLPQLEELQRRIPGALSDLMQLPGLGPKRVKLLYRELKIRNHEDLLRAARSGKLAELPGFGPKLMQKITEALLHAVTGPKRTRLADAEQVVMPILAHLKKLSGVTSVEVAGSFRRRQETVGDLDILAVADRPVAVIRRFVAYPGVAEVLSQGDTRSSIRLRSGMQVDLRVVPQESHGAALYYLTGSKAHNIAVRKLAQARKLKINEYGIYRGEKRIAGRSEAELFETMGLAYIPPELRENRGEIAAASRGRLPALITAADLRGDLHSHTRETDGRDSLQDMADAARARGYEYLAVTDHTRRVSVAHGMDERRLRAQMAVIDRLNAGFRGFRLLKSAEVDILEDGALDLPDSVLRELDVVVGAVHYGLDMPRTRQTRRLLKALDNPRLHILAHPTGRLIDSRRPMDYDFERILRAAKEACCCLEVDSQPERLDLDDVHCKLAKEMGVRLVISSDAHSAGGLALIRFGVDQARRGWLEARDVLNTQSLDGLLAGLKR